MPEKISIIIPVFNRKDLIPFTLSSLDSRLHPGEALEVIVVDDGSTDGVIDWVKNNHPEVIILENKSKGAGAARNTGLYAATSKYVLYLDSDDLLGQGFLRGKIDFLESQADRDACYGEYEYFNSDGEFNASQIFFKHKYPQLTGENTARMHLINNLKGRYLPASSIVWRREFLCRINGHDPELPINQDVELLVRALFEGLKMQAISDNTFVYIRKHGVGGRVSDAGESQSKLQSMLQLRKRFFEQLKAHDMATPEFTKPLSENLFNCWRNYRFINVEMANNFLHFAKQVYWPVELKGSVFYNLAGRLIGPDNAVKWKYRLFKR